MGYFILQPPIRHHRGDEIRLVLYTVYFKEYAHPLLHYIAASQARIQYKFALGSVNISWRLVLEFLVETEKKT